MRFVKVSRRLTWNMFKQSYKQQLHGQKNQAKVVESGGKMCGCWTLTKNTKDTSQNHVCITCHFIPRDLWIHECNQPMLWTSNNSFISMSVGWSDLGNNEDSDWHFVADGESMHFQLVQWFLVIVRCINCCFYLGSWHGTTISCNGGPLSTFDLQWFWLRASMYEASYDGPSDQGFGTFPCHCKSLLTIKITQHDGNDIGPMS